MLCDPITGGPITTRRPPTSTTTPVTLPQAIAEQDYLYYDPWRDDRRMAEEQLFGNLLLKKVSHQSIPNIL